MIKPCQSSFDCCKLQPTTSFIAQCKWNKWHTTSRVVQHSIVFAESSYYKSQIIITIILTTFVEHKFEMQQMC